MLDTTIDRVVRVITEKAANLAPARTRRAMQRHARGREDTRNLQRADFAVVSFGKSGRTWLNTMIARFFQTRFQLKECVLFNFDNLHRKNRGIPKILFTHDNYIRDYVGCGDLKTAFYDKATVLLVRHPGDVAVSQFFQWRYRMRPHKKTLNRYPAHGAEVSIFDFVMHQEAGLERAVAFLNEWAREMPRLKRLLTVRYEDLRSDPAREMARILTWLGQNPSDQEVRDCVEFASFENLKRLESQQAFASSGKRIAPGDTGNPDSYKVRRAKVGGFRDYFDDDQVREIEAYIRAHLDPVFGYDSAAQSAAE
ncbi:MAG TPA: sulfotransferase domain-containing protein [Candidatus Binatia bacterium]|nr:sulfotransferase domain-containing protein [Candidatus Binatia bacterium]